jgi:hypothetical protein
LELIRGGTPAGLITTSGFERLAHGEMAALGATELPLIVIDHPLGGESPEGVGRRVAQAAGQLAEFLGGRG